VQGCCHVVTQASPFGGESEVEWKVFSACCQALDNPVIACTPWGPPVPPSFDLADHLLRWRKAVA